MLSSEKTTEVGICWERLPILATVQVLVAGCPNQGPRHAALLSLVPVCHQACALGHWGLAKISGQVLSTLSCIFSSSVSAQNL